MSSNSATGDPIDPIYWPNTTLWNNSNLWNNITFNLPAQQPNINTGYANIFNTLSPYLDVDGVWLTKEEATEFVLLGKKVKVEEQIRTENPALQSIWEEYQTMLALVKEDIIDDV